MDIRFHENGIHFWLHVTEDNDALLLALGRERSGIPAEGASLFRPVQVQLTGAGNAEHHGCKMIGSLPGSALKYVSCSDARNELGRKVELVQEKDGLTVTSHYQFYNGIPAVRCWTQVANHGAQSCTLEYVSSLAVTGLLNNGNTRDSRAKVHIPHNTWYGECQWKTSTLSQLGYDPLLPTSSMKRIALRNTGTWACCEHLPMGGINEADGSHTYLWQIENNSSWYWEISDAHQEMYLLASGPSWQDNGWSTDLAVGDEFTSVPCALVYTPDGGFDGAIQAMTRYRRAIRRPNPDNEHPSVIFNDYMNCLDGDPTTEKEKPLIVAADKVRCKYYCVDAGWYSDGPWWDGVGEWLPSKARFPGGLKEVLDDIRAHNMIPGLWLELEVMGIRCPLADKLPDDWFFQRRGKRVIDHGRYQLDYSNPEVRKYADGVIDRLVNEYGVGYIKMDYNINAGVGTDRGGVTMGEGLLRHTRAYLSWLDEAFKRYPELVIENCSSGGMRMEYSMLSRHSIQSVTDQTNYLKMAAIACNCTTAVTPEQAAIWSYPLRDGDQEEACFNMVNAMLFRIHQSGQLETMDKERLALVAEGLRTHLSIVEELKEGVPFWPIGLADFSRPTLCVGIDCGANSYMAVWNVSGEEQTVELPTAGATASLLYPTTLPRAWSAEGDTLRVILAPRTASLYKLAK